MTHYRDIVFDGPPGPEAPRFIEVEDETGASVNFGEWVQRPAGQWALRVPHVDLTIKPTTSFRGVIAAILSVHDALGTESARELLRRFGVPYARKLKPEQFAEFREACLQELAK